MLVNATLFKIRELEVSKLQTRAIWRCGKLFQTVDFHIFQSAPRVALSMSAL